MGDDDELRVAAKLFDGLAETVDIGFVQSRVDFIQDAERGWRDAQNGEDQRTGCQGAFAT